jgi:hypothetical protein
VNDVPATGAKGPGRAVERFDVIAIGGGEFAAPRLVHASRLAASRWRCALGWLLPGAYSANCHSGVQLTEFLAPMIPSGSLDLSLNPFSARRFDVPPAV